MPEITGTVTENEKGTFTNYEGTATTTSQTFTFSKPQNGMHFINKGDSILELTVGGKKHTIPYRSSINIDDIKFGSFDVKTKSGTCGFALISYALKGDIDTEVLDEINERFTELTAQLAQNTTNPVFKTEKNEKPKLGEELIGFAIANLGAGWSGDVVTGFTHAKGTTEDLILTFPTLGEKLYQLEVGINKPDMSDRNGTSDYYVSLGGSVPFETYRGVVENQYWGIRSAGLSNDLVITPDIDFEGTLTLFIKEIIAPNEAHTTFEDSGLSTSLELRPNLSETNSVYIGKDSGKYSLQENGEQNVSIGDNSLSSNTSGFWNSAIGFNALRNNTVGSRNIAIGRVALEKNISGDRNIGIGTFALTRNETGRNNIAIGADSLWYNINGSNNIGIGLTSFSNNINGEYNIGLGHRVASSSSGGQYNIAIGYRAMSSFKEAIENIGIGTGALTYSEGEYNIAFGYHSNYGNTTGSGNISIGRHSMALNKTGSNNVSIGLESMRNSDEALENIAIGTRTLLGSKGANNIAVGYQSSYHNDTGENNTAIGNTAMQLNKDGSRNVAVGHCAMRRATGGNDNIAIGNNALASRNEVSIGDGNIGIGISALYWNEGSNNIGIGNSTLLTNITGDDNIAIGRLAGKESESGSGNILIGYNAQKSTPDGERELNIGNVIRSKDMSTGVIEIQKLKLTALPTVQPTEAGMLWNDNGTIKIS